MLFNIQNSSDVTRINILQLLDNILSHVEGLLEEVEDLLDVGFLSLVGWLLVVAIKGLDAYFCLVEVDAEHGNKLVQKDISIRKEPYQHRLLRRIKHDCTGLDELLDNLLVDKGLGMLMFYDGPIVPLYSNSFLNLIDLLVDCQHPLFKVFFAETSQDPFACVILEFETVLVHAIQLLLFTGRLQYLYFCVLKTDHVYVLFLSARCVLLIVKQLFSKKNKLPWLKFMMIQ